MAYRKKIGNKQKKLAIGLLNGEGKGEAMRNAGYAPSVARTPSLIMKTKGFHLAMAEVAADAGYVASSLIAHIKARMMTDELDSLNIVESTKVLERVVNTAHKLSEISGIKARKETIDGLDNIIDIG